MRLSSGQGHKEETFVVTVPLSIVLYILIGTSESSEQSDKKLTGYLPGFSIHKQMQPFSGSSFPKCYSISRINKMLILFVIFTLVSLLNTSTHFSVQKYYFMWL